MAGHFPEIGTHIGCVVVGADRIAANGDVANKVGTLLPWRYLAKENGRAVLRTWRQISTLDLTLASGDSIPIRSSARRWKSLTFSARRLRLLGPRCKNPARSM